MKEWHLAVQVRFHLGNVDQQAAQKKAREIAERLQGEMAGDIEGLNLYKRDEP